MKWILPAVIVGILVIIAGLYLQRSLTPEPSPSSTPFVGGDRDEHGCIGSAGYTWCEAKQKCLRVWEEPCEEDVAEQVRFLLASKYDKTMDEVTVSVTRQSGDHAAGNVFFAAPGLPSPGEGGGFLAVRRNGVWQVVYDGNGSVECDSLRSDYGFPDDILTGFCDPMQACTEEAKVCPDGTSVGRTGPNCEFAPCPGEE